MLNPRLRRVLAFTALISALSLVPAQAASRISREPRQASIAERLEHWGASAWGLLTGLWEKRSVAIDPLGSKDPKLETASSDGGR